MRARIPLETSRPGTFPFSTSTNWPQASSRPFVPSTGTGSVRLSSDSSFGAARPGTTPYHFVVFGAMNRKDWRTVVVENVAFEREELARQLFPTLHFHAIHEQNAFGDYGTRLVNECREAFSLVLPFRDTEREFLCRLLDKG